MSAKENPCKKFQANIFNKSKCQNCFKPRESHLLSDEDLNQAKPIYGGWLLLAPEGTDFDNPMHRSRKWQRRFFILYEHGLLRYALDEMPTTLPQGTINMNQCTEVIDGENRTGQKFSLCILTPEEHFIRAENKEIINGWLEMLIVYPKTNKQNQKKKRKVEPPTPQEPGPAKMAATSAGIPTAEKVPATKSTLWQEEAKSKDGQSSSSSGGSSPIQSPVQGPSSPSEPMPESKDDASMVNGDRVDGAGRKTRVESGYFSLEKTKDLKPEEQPPQTPPSPSTPDAPSRRSLVIEKFEALDIEKAEHMETSASAAPSGEARQGRSEKRTFPRKREETVPDVSATSVSQYRRAKSLDRRSTESSMTPDLLNFKKGWLTKQYQDGQWKKHWFVLTDQNLRYYRDSVAEEAADLDGEIDLSTCYDVTEFPVQRNYGFQIHTKEGEFTLSAMTSGIRRNWIQTIMKHVRPNTAPDVTSSLPEEKSKTLSSFMTSALPNDKQDSEHPDADGEQKRSRARERRREGRSKTFDWAEFRPIQQALAQERAQAAEAVKPVCYDAADSKSDLGELERERARRREVRRKRFESSDSVEESTGEEASRMEVDKGPAASDSIDIRPNVQVEIEQRWQQVETTPLREERQIPISPLPLSSASPKHPAEDITSLLEKQLEQSQKEVSDLLAENLVLQQRLKEALEQQQSARDGYVLQTELADPSSDAWQRLHKVNADLRVELEAQRKHQEALNRQVQSLKHGYAEAKASIRDHEAEILGLQARLNGAVAELLIKEQALTKLKGDLNAEKEKAKETLEGCCSREMALGSQLKVSQQKLKEAESLLLEKRQEIRELEIEQALQMDYRKERERLQEKLLSLQAQLDASEQARLSTEERVQMNYEELLGSYEKEKQILILNLKETEERLVNYDDLLQEKEQLVEVLQKEKLNASAEASVLVYHLQEQLVGRDSTIRGLEECIKDLEKERDQLKSTCQQMSRHIAASGADASSLQNRLEVREVEYTQLKNLLEKSREELLKVQESLRAKEEELRKTCDTHKRLVEKKDQDINEALIKMAALGSSLEEMEAKLKAKEDALKSLYGLSSESQAKELESVYGPLEAVKPSDVYLEPSAGDVFGEEHRGGRNVDIGHVGPKSSASAGVISTCAEKEQDAAAKRQRIRFSSIQCQKYSASEDTDRVWTMRTSSDPGPEQHFSCEPAEIDLQHPSLGPGEMEHCMAVIRSLESKLYETEEKLNNVISKLENEKSSHQEMILGLHNQWARAEASLREQLQNSIAEVDTKAKQLEEVQREKLELLRCHPDTAKRETFCCLKACSSMLKELHGVDEAQLTPNILSSIKSALENTIHFLQQMLLESAASVRSPDDTCCSDEISPTESPLPAPQDTLQALAEKIHFQSKLMHRMAESLKLAAPETDLCAEQSAAEHTDDHLVEMFTRKVRLERDFWDKVDQLGSTIVRNKGLVAPEEPELSPDSHPDLLQTLADNTRLKAELDSIFHKAKTYYQRMRALENDLKKAKADSVFEEGSMKDQEAHPSGSEPLGPTNTDVSFLDELSLTLKENADVLRMVSSALTSVPHADFEGAVQSLIHTTQQLFRCSQSCNFPPLFLQDAIMQAQLCYISCKTQLECKREETRRKDALCLAHSEALARVHLEYQELLQKKHTELSEALQRERSAADAVTSQAGDAERFLREAEANFKETISQLDSRYKEEIQNLMEECDDKENVLRAQQVQLQAKLHASEKEMANREKLHQEQMKRVGAQFQEQLQDLQMAHRNEMSSLEAQYTQSIQQLQHTLDSCQRERHALSPADSTTPGTETDAMNVLRSRILQLESQMNMMREELEQKDPQANMTSIKEKYQMDFENLKATCERGFAAMEETHQKKIEDLQRQHQRELEKLREEKDRLLDEETAATISAIEAMKNAHREELERELEKSHRSQISSVNADVESLRRQYLEELQSIQRELEVLSEQYSQKCLENAHLAQALEAERQALRQCQRENQELNAHNQELNNRLATEITRLRTLVTGDGGDVSPLTQGKDSYELEVLLRVKESEIQYQKQEISSLKDELQTALRDKKYASDKYKDIYTELSNVKAKAECDISRLKEQLKAATEMLGDKTPENASVSGYDIMKSKSNPDFLKNDRSSINRQLRNIRSKSLKEGLTVQERLKIFESQDFKKH